MHRPVLALLIRLWLALATAAAAAETRPPSLHITQAQSQVVAGQGLSTPAASLRSEDLPQDWQPVKLPHAPPIELLRQAASARTASSTTLTTWYRIGLPERPASNVPQALYGARVKTDGTVAVYADGLLLHRAQLEGPLWNSSRVPLWVPLKTKAGGFMPREILIRLEHSAASQVALSSLRVGPVGDLSWRHASRNWFQLELPAMFNHAFLAVGIFSLCIWARRRHERGYLLLFVLAITAYLRGLHVYEAVPIANPWFSWLTLNALFWLVCTAHFSLKLLHGRQLTWLTRGLVALCVLVALLSALSQAHMQQWRPLIYAVAALMGATVCLAGLRSSWRLSSDGLLVAAGVGVCTVLGMFDWLLHNNHISPEGWYAGAYTNAASFTVFGYLMYRQYIDAIAEVEQTNAQLEQRLKAREAELAESYERLHQAQHRQTLSQERQRLTQDMHDGLGSSLISALRVVEGGRLSEEEVAEVLKGCIDDLKLTIDSMEPVEADLLLLLATLRFRLGPRLSAAGIALRWEVVDVPALDWLEPRNALHILRILQEAIANILKHTQASEIRVSTAVERSEGVEGVRVTICDNGAGFCLEAAMRSGGKGLHNQLRRAKSIGATLRWNSDSSATSLHLWLPQNRSPT